MTLYSLFNHSKSLIDGYFNAMNDSFCLINDSFSVIDDSQRVIRDIRNKEFSIKKALPEQSLYFCLNFKLSHQIHLTPALGEVFIGIAFAVVYFLA